MRRYVFRPRNFEIWYSYVTKESTLVELTRPHNQLVYELLTTDDQGHRMSMIVKFNCKYLAAARRQYALVLEGLKGE